MNLDKKKGNIDLKQKDDSSGGAPTLDIVKIDAL